jgi:hypothetical protein
VEEGQNREAEKRKDGVRSVKKIGKKFAAVIMENNEKSTVKK